jgi:hypothetical protein
LNRSDATSVSVIISNYNTLDTLKLTLESFRHQEQEPHEVIVADDGSSDSTIEWLDSLSDDAFTFPLHYVTHQHCGYGLVTINNLAARRATGERLLFTNADLLHCPESVLAHAMIPPYCIGGGFIHSLHASAVELVDIETVRDFANVQALTKQYPSNYTNAEFLIRKPDPNYWGVWGGNMSYPKDMFDEVGGFDEEFRGKYGAEEADIILRLFKLGCHVRWVRKSESVHLDHPDRAYKVEKAGLHTFMAKTKKGNRDGSDSCKEDCGESSSA